VYQKTKTSPTFLI